VFRRGNSIKGKEKEEGERHPRRDERDFLGERSKNSAKLTYILLCAQRLSPISGGELLKKK